VIPHLNRSSTRGCRLWGGTKTRSRRHAWATAGVRDVLDLQDKVVSSVAGVIEHEAQDGVSLPPTCGSELTVSPARRRRPRHVSAGALGPSARRAPRQAQPTLAAIRAVLADRAAAATTSPSRAGGDALRRASPYAGRRGRGSGDVSVASASSVVSGHSHPAPERVPTSP